MTKNPFINALLAAGYICGLVSLMTLFVDSEVEHLVPMLIPILMLSLFTLSTAVMGMIFFYEPFRMYFDGQKAEAFSLVLKTVGCFAAFAAVLLATAIIIAV